MKPSWTVWRRLSQGAVALGFIAVPLLNAKGRTAISGNLLSLDFFGLTLVDPLAFLQTLAGGPPAGRAALGAAIIVLIALMLGRVFCGWLCPYGLASELVFAARGRRPKTGDRRVRPPAVRYAVAGAGLMAVFLFLPEPWLNQLSMPGWYSRALQLALFSGALPLGAFIFPTLLLLEALGGSRFWCRYLCPQSVCLALAARCLPGGFGIKWAPGPCACPREARPCQKACSLGLSPRQKGGPPRGECFQCADCVEACAKHGAALRLGL
ncbi:MAG: 4Fe-4S binding protein [Candidatus Adiutrix sp.]|jgi:ferredoxin-type protein NapH|nr:4Fe-4S binding protein [Candidatus Adiutrix sp.]